jgi:hypothetical protein
MIERERLNYGSLVSFDEKTELSSIQGNDIDWLELPVEKIDSHIDRKLKQSNVIIDDALDKVGYLNGNFEHKKNTYLTERELRKSQELVYDKLEFMPDTMYDREHQFILEANMARFISINIDMLRNGRIEGESLLVEAPLSFLIVKDSNLLTV